MTLSDEALALLLGPLMHRKMKLTYNNVEGMKSPEAEKGLEQLVAAGLVTCEREGSAESYTLTEAGAAFDRRSITDDPFAWMDQRGRFPLSVPRVGA